MHLLTSDLCDAHPDARVLALPWRSYGGQPRFHGPVRTVKVYEDNLRVRALLETPGTGAVLVVDGGGSQRCALVGGQLGELAVRNGWAGIVVHGCVRDSAELAALAVGVFALGTHPRKSDRGLHGGADDRPLSFGGTTVAPGDWLYADEDGVVVLASAHAG